MNTKGKAYKDAVLVPLDTNGDEKPEALPDSNQRKFSGVYCRAAEERSEQASGKLVAL